MTPTILLFAYLQILDVASTLVGFSLGNAEASPFIRLLIHWGPATGLVLSKAIATGLAVLCFATKRAALIRWINYWYAGLVLWNLWVALQVLNSTAQLTGGATPAARLAPEQVVEIAARALQHNNSPQPNSGILTVYRFASPANRAVTGPYGRFLRNVKTPAYAPMFEDRRVEFASIARDQDHASQIERVWSARGEPAEYRWDLTRQREPPYRDCWMVDGVARVP